VKKRVLLLTWEYPPRKVGDMSEYCYSLVHGLKEEVDFEILTFDDWRIGSEERDGIIVHSVGNSQKNTLNTLDWVLSLNIDFGRKGSEILHLKKFDIIHANEWITVPAAISLKKVFNIPLVLTVHSLEDERSPYVNNNYVNAIKQIEWLGCFNADKIITKTLATRDSILRFYQAPPQKIFAIPPFVEGWTRATMDRYRNLWGGGH